MDDEVCEAMKVKLKMAVDFNLKFLLFFNVIYVFIY